MSLAPPTNLAEPSLPLPLSRSHRLREFVLLDTNVVVAAVIITNLLRALSSVVLTRLLVPEVFGISGVIASIAFTFTMVSDLGFQPFVVRHPHGDKPRFLDTVWTMAILRSILLTCLLVALAPTIAGLFGKPELATVIAVSALTFLIEGFASLSLLTALRNRMVLRLSLLELGVLVVQIGLSFVLAYFWRNYWAILVSMLTASMVKTLLSYLVFSNSVRRLRVDPLYLRELWAFARFVTGSSMITLLLLQGDRFLLGRIMSLDDFAFYVLAVNLAGAPLAFASSYGARILFPTYAKAWHDKEENLRELFYEKRRIPSLIYSFVAGGLIGSAPLVIAILYDPRYVQAAHYFQILAIAPLFALISNSGTETLTATGHIKITFQANVVKLVWFCLATPAGYILWGITGIVVAVGLMEIPAIALKWAQMRRLDMLDLRQEMQFLAAGAVGIAVGMVADGLVRPLI